MIDVGVRGDDILRGQVVTRENLLDAVDVVAGIDHHGLTRGFVSDDRAVALKHPDRDDFVDHSLGSSSFSL